MDTPDLDDAQRAADRAGDHPVVRHGARAGYAATGLLHLLVGYLAIRIGLHSGGGSADQSGAFSTIAKAPGGTLVLWVCAAAFALLALWQLTQAASRFGERLDRLKSVATAVVYVAIAWASAKFALGSGRSSSGQSEDFTASLLHHTGGRIVVVLIGLIVIGVGGYHCYKGVTRHFLEDLAEHPPATVVWAGVAGYALKGIALLIVGFLFCVAGFRSQASKAGGLDEALKSLQGQPLGSALLLVVGIGIGLYGVYSVAKARYARV